MSKINFSGQSYDMPKEMSLLDFIKQNAKRESKDTIAAKFNGQEVDLTYIPETDGNLELIFTTTNEGLEILRHSTSHLMAQAVKRLYPNVQVTIGPAIKDGFYYDFDTDKPFTDEDLPKIEAEMKKIIKENIPVFRKIMTKKDAIEYFKKNNEPYKVEIIEDIDADTVSFYEQGDFIDLCRGPHVPSTGYLKSYKLMSVAGSYWRGDSNNKMLSRIYGTAFESKESLDNYLKKLKEAKERDHRKLGKELNLFSFHDEGPGFPFWHPRGMIIYKEVESYIRKENEKRGYVEIKTPAILNEELWHRSGHWDNYKENMYFTEIDETKFAIKPMNCPGGLIVYNSNIHSYRDLPLRVAELGFVHRHELSGALHGLFRVRAFTQDDAHIFCTEEQLADEIINTIDYYLSVYKDFGFKNFEIFVSTRPAKSIGTDEAWELATNSLINALDKLNIAYKINEGDGAFYGPKIDFNIKDVLDRNWQCGTLQVDFSLPMRFEISYEGKDGRKHTPVMLHRAILGSMERFIGILTEHYNGKFPLWLSPLQVAIVNVLNDKNQIERVKEIANAFKNENFRVEIDDGNDNLGTKIKKYRLQRTPYTVIIGAEELSSGKLSVRTRSSKELKDIDLIEFIEKLKKESKERMNDSIFST
ncbi:threonine--tRNA ligase [Brachyspira aalborgi]|jgi:threonyl-tRNA synthetase|uniref:Threonine--tRNA ligase n=1 Tax=Brachyspira aalborgi TaxID=29522 RepID=A0ABY3K6A8_9SPIR|nr:threonine--tRNA ligase [Brachyspira aalborgi]MBS4763049.1 threonine--tRNA ligase [Brachyspira sp.]TXJ30766.1 threonine--tRNA ligase [Brachyspira aalborgi]TXJ42903.1 threonine--tRNA ligase [Brachyspira aalborgi]CCY78684.1 threonine--tRNA ligase [Brachyspira sp. CAG:700]